MNLNGLAVDAITVFVAVSPVASLYLPYTPVSYTHLDVYKRQLFLQPEPTQTFVP